MELKIHGVTKKYGEKYAVDNLTVTFQQGVNGLLGANGSGKSTLMKMMCDITKPSKGTIMLNGVDISTMGEDYRSILGYLPQDFGYYPYFSGWDFMMYLASVKGLTPSKAKKRSTELLQMVGLYDVRKKKIKGYSGGMKQRLGIAQSLLNDPDILILDEPTSGLDPLMQNIFVKYINEEKKKGKTILMSSHLFEEVEKTCDKVAIIKNGRIATIDTIANLKKNQSKKFTITFNNKKDIEKFKKENIKIVDIFEKRITLIIQNNLKLFFSLLNKYDIVDIYEETQGIEDIFLDYYGGNKND